MVYICFLLFVFSLMVYTSACCGKWLHTQNLIQIQFFWTHLGSEKLRFILIAKFDEADGNGGSSLYQSVTSNACICSVCVVYVCVCVHARVRACMRVCVCVHACVSMRACVCMCVCVHACMCVCNELSVSLCLCKCSGLLQNVAP